MTQRISEKREKMAFKSSQLAIVIPTYERANNIAYWLKKNLEKLAGENIHLIIADGSRDSETKNAVESILLKNEKMGGYFSYEKFPSGMDVESRIREVMRRYVDIYDYFWICGDKYVLRLSEIAPLIKRYFQSGQDIVVFNEKDVFERGEKYYTESRKFFRECFYCSILYGATIVKKDIIRLYFDDSIWNKYFGTFVACQAIVMEWCAKNEFKAVHTSVAFYDMTKYSRGSSWRGKFLQQGVDYFCKTVDLLPDIYTSEDKAYVIALQDEIYHSFNTKDLIACRRNGALPFWQVKKYKSDIKRVTKYPYSLLVTISLIPKWAINGVAMLKRMLKRKGQIA